MGWTYTPDGASEGHYGAFWLLVDTFAAGLVAFLLAIQWRYYISSKRDVKLIKKNLLLGVLDRAVLREVDIAEFALLGREKKPEAPKVRASAVQFGRGGWRWPAAAAERCVRVCAAASLSPPPGGASAPLLLPAPPALARPVPATLTAPAHAPSLPSQLVAPPRRQYAKAVLDDAKRRMIVQLRWFAMQAKAKRDAKLRRPVAELEAEKAQLKKCVNMYIARRRAVNILHVLAADKYKSGSLDSSIKCLDAMRRLSQYNSSTYMIVEHGGMNAALEAMENYPKSADVQWHACTLFGNLGMSLVLLVRLHLHPEVKHGRTALLIIRAIAEFPHDVRVQGAACGALWTLVMAVGKSGQELAIRGGAVPLLVAAVKKHPHSGIVVYNACGALLTIVQGFPDVQTILQGDGSTRVLKKAMDKHGGIEHMYGTEVANLADWVGLNAKPKRNVPALPGKVEYVTEKLYQSVPSAGWELCFPDD